MMFMAKRGRPSNNLILARAICDKYVTGEYTLESCCNASGVPYATFYSWITENRNGFVQDIQDLYKKTLAEKRIKESSELVHLAKTALKKKLSFDEYKEKSHEEKTSPDGIIKTDKTITKIMIPGTGDIALALNNLDDDFKERQDIGNKENLGDALEKWAGKIRESDTA